jgi:aquaporin rerated protein, other eukaryote
LVGAIIASALLLGLTPGPLLIKSKLGDGTSLVQGVFIEMFCTAILLLAILMLAAEKSALTPFAPIGISMTLFAVHMFAITFTGASLNPARSFGPSCLVGFGHDHWIYWVGPLAGSCLSVAFYAWLKQYVFRPFQLGNMLIVISSTKYWDINPKQMDTNWRDSPEDPIAAAERRERERRAVKDEKSLRRPTHVTPNDEYDPTGVIAHENV